MYENFFSWSISAFDIEWIFFHEGQDIDLGCKICIHANFKVFLILKDNIIFIDTILEIWPLKNWALIVSLNLSLKAFVKWAQLFQQTNKLT